MDKFTDVIYNNWAIVTYILIFSTIGFIFLHNKRGSKHYHLPPGPLSLPVLGTLPFLGSDVREPLRRLSKDYGDIFTVYFGSRKVIILNSYEAIKEAFVKKGSMFIGRPDNMFLLDDSQKGKGLIASQGELWKENRKLSHSILREFGLGSSYMEDRIHEETVHLCNLIAEHLNEPWDPASSLHAALCNVIYSMCFGKRREYTDPWFVDYLNVLSKASELLGNAGVVIVFPSLKYLPGDLFHLKEFKRFAETIIKDFYKDMINKAKETYQEGRVRDFIDAYLKVMYEREKEGRDTTLTVEDMPIVLSDLVGAGTETSASTLRWGLVYMLRHPDIQQKIQAEIDEVISNDEPSMQHRLSMPYTEACLLEIQRIGDIVPLGVPHTTTEDVQLMGYDIPGDTMVISNLYAVHFDPALWPDPHHFNPQRFLDSDGKLQRSEKVIPFSMGKRACLGESLARMELFLFFVTMLQNFTFELPASARLPEQNGKVGLTHMPNPFNVVIKRRI